MLVGILSAALTLAVIVAAVGWLYARELAERNRLLCEQLYRAGPQVTTTEVVLVPVHQIVARGQLPIWYTEN